jgi:CheY-like chemotaxis protein
MCKLLNQSKLRKVSLTEKEKILVIDDDPLIRNNMLKMLKSIVRKYNMDYEILEGDDGAELINLVQDDSENLIRLIFTDENMTKVEGSEAINTIREIKQKNLIKVVSITSLEDDLSVQRILRCGVDRVLKKPATRRILEYICRSMDVGVA